MYVTKTDFHALGRIVLAGHAKGTVPQGLIEDFLDWGEKNLGSMKQGGDTVELPPQFARLVNMMRASKDYHPDSEALQLAMDQQLNPHRYERRESQKTLFPPMSQNAFLRKLEQLIPSTQAAFYGVETARSHGSESEITQAVRRALASAAREERALLGDPIENFLRSNPEQHILWNGIARRFGGGRTTEEESRVLKAWVPGDPNIGAGMFPIPVSPELWDILLK